MKCPLCHQELIKVIGDYFCPLRVSFSVNLSGYSDRIDNSLPHFEYRRRGSVITKYYVPPYQIINEDNKSEIWILDDTRITHLFPVFKFILRTNKIHPDDPPKLLERIDNLITFS